MLVCRPLYKNESDLLIGNESQTLIIKDLDGVVIRSIYPPKSGWTHDLLDRVVSYMGFSIWDAYLGAQWIGSSEV